MPPGSAERLKASCYVDSVAVDIVDSGDDVTEINADAQFNAMRIQDLGIPLSHRLLQRDGASHRLNRTREFHQNAVAFDPYNPPGMSLDAWPNHVLQYTLQTAPRSDLVLTSKPAIADHVGKQDCCQATLHTLLRHRLRSRSIRPALALDTIAKTNGASLHLELTCEDVSLMDPIWAKSNDLRASRLVLARLGHFAMSAVRLLSKESGH